MAAERKIGHRTLRLVKDEISLLQVDGITFYAQPDLQLGSGFGGAIARRGGPGIQKELDAIGKVETTEVVVTSGGKLKAKHILHAVGPAFQEPQTPDKLRRTVENVMRKAEEQGLKRIALPAMGAGFYGVPLADSARITLEVVHAHLSNSAQLDEVIVCLNDNREYRAFEGVFESLS